MSDLRFHRISRSIFAAGVLLRIAVFAALNGANLDDHYQYIQFIRQTHTLPRAADMNMGFHPPLYYLLAIPFDALGGLKGVQFLSLLLSIIGLVLIWKLCDRELFPDRFTQLMCRAFGAFLSQYILYGLYVSNDALAFVVGTLLAICTVRLIRRPTRLNLSLLAACEAIGLLTKGTFLAFLPVLAVAIYVAGPGSRGRKISATAGCIAGAIVLGGYKFAQNIHDYGRPLVHNLDFNPSWAAPQRPTYVGPSTFLDLNVLKLIANPLSSDVTIHSYWLPLYGTFWYQQQTISNFKAAWHGWWWIGSAIFIFAPVPTLLAVVGAIGLIRPKPGSSMDNRRAFEHRALTAFSMMNITLILYLLLRYDVASISHARLLFPSLAGFIVLLGRGWMMLPNNRRYLRSFVAITTGAALAANVIFLIVEILFSFGALHPLSIGPQPL